MCEKHIILSMRPFPMRCDQSVLHRRRLNQRAAASNRAAARVPSGVPMPSRFLRAAIAFTALLTTSPLLAEEVAAPAVGHTRGVHGAGSAAGADRGPVVGAADQRGRELRERGPGAELAGRPIAEAPQRAVARQRAGVARAGGDADHAVPDVRSTMVTSSSTSADPLVPKTWTRQ